MKLTDDQIEALKEWLRAQAYNGRDFGIGSYLRLDELEAFLPEALEDILLK